MVKIKSKNAKSKDLSQLSVEKFFETEMSDGNEINDNSSVKKVKKSKKLKSKDKITDSKTHKKQLDNLKIIDPEFYSFLEKNDKKLLKFDFSDDDDMSESNQGKDLTHKPTDELEVASDEEDFDDGEEHDDEDETDPTKAKLITIKLLKVWEAELQADKIKLDTIKLVVQAFNSALISVTNEKEQTNTLRVEGAAIFNGVIQISVLNLQTAINRYLGLIEKSKKSPHKTKKWNKLKVPLRNYFVDLTNLLQNVSSGHVSTILLKHLHQMLPFLVSYGPNIIKPILKRLVSLWSTSEETVRIVAFLCILRITRNKQVQYLGTVLKAMYMSYVRNSKFVSPSTLPAINFMRRSLVEMFALDLNLSYQHSFLYIRQLAIHLRNAVTLNKKESYQAVYNWQFLNSLKLWADLLSFTYNKQQLQPLIYPLVSIITGAIKLIPTGQYIPLRFHCVRILIKLSKDTNIFIPVLPYILEVLESTTFNKKPSETFMKPMSFTCIFRVNKKEMASNVFRDEIVENIYGLLLEYLSAESSSISFPDLSLISTTALRKYIKTCKHHNYSRKLKQLCEKIEETSKFVENERNKISFTLNDLPLIQSWETTLKNRGTPLSIFYVSWEKTNQLKQKRHAIDSEDINDYQLPKINRKLVSKKKTDDDGPVDLFPSDEDDEDSIVEEEKPKKKKKSKKVEVIEEYSKDDEMEVDEDDDGINDVDIVKDLDLDDWN